MKGKPEKQPVLEIENLSIGYKSGKNITQVLSDIDLKLYSGELVCLLGPNGVGKSTLLRTISGIQRPLSGTVKVGGVDLLKMDQSGRSKMISLVLTEKVSVGNLNVYELVALGRFPHTNWVGNLSEKDLQHIEWALYVTGADLLTDKKLYQLSDGQLQKVMIARALAQDGAIVILDEPTAFLDVNNKISIMQMLKKLSETTSKAILISTHDIDLALQVSDKLWLSQYKKPIVSGVPEDLIIKGVLGSVFQQENLDFDISSGRFRIKPHFTKTISVEGEGPATAWTIHALEREGYKIVEDDKDISLVVKSNASHSIWVLTHYEQSYSFTSIEDLLAYLAA